MPTQPTPAPELAQAILRMVQDMLAATRRWRMDWAPPALFCPALWNRLLRMGRQLLRLAEAHAAGRLRPAPAVAEPSVLNPAPAPLPARPGHPLPPRILPAGQGWLLAAMRHWAAAHANGLRGLLADPGMAALLAASPGALRIVRSFCRLLAVPTTALPRPARRPPPAPLQPPTRAPLLARPFLPSRVFSWPPLPDGPPLVRLPRHPLRWTSG